MKLAPYNGKADQALPVILPHRCRQCLFNCSMSTAVINCCADWRCCTTSNLQLHFPMGPQWLVL
jgi:hypothetical protein